MSTRKRYIFTHALYQSSIFNQSTQVLDLPDVGTIDNTDIAAKVILFNDDWHTFDDVINQLIKAIHCTPQKAEDFAWEVHTRGKACVYGGDIPECLRVSGVLEEIALHTQVEY